MHRIIDLRAGTRIRDAVLHVYLNPEFFRLVGQVIDLFFLKAFSNFRKLRNNILKGLSDLNLVSSSMFPTKAKVLLWKGWKANA